MISPSEADHRLAVLHENFMFESSVEGLSEPEAIYLSVYRLQLEAYNGGIKQFFTNSSGVFTPYLPGALTKIGADEMRVRFEDAVSIIGADVDWYDDQARWDRVKSLNEDKLNGIFELEHGFLDLLQQMGVKLFEYVSKHKSYFEMPDEFWTEKARQ